MRDPLRVWKFCYRLASAWEKMPEQRFGQLALNYFHWLEEHGKVPFYMEDEELIQKYEEYIGIFTEIPKAP